jgi:hypothetical protein
MEAQLRRDRRPMAGCSAVWPLYLHLERWIASVVERLLVAVSSLYLVISTRGGPSRGDSERDDEIAFGPDRCPPSTAAAHRKSAGINTHKRGIHEPVEPVLCKTNSSSPQCTRYTLGKAAWIFRPSGVCIKAASDEAQKGFCRTCQPSCRFSSCSLVFGSASLPLTNISLPQRCPFQPHPLRITSCLPAARLMLAHCA